MLQINNKFMKKPLISIVTVVYNNEKGIAKTIDSVISQTYPAIEYIIIDGGSTDGTVDIINGYKSGITKFISEKDSGIYDAMNKGIRNANGEIIGLINSGDHLEPGCLDAVAKAYLENPTYDVFHGLMRVYSSSEKFICIIGNDSSTLSGGMIEHAACFVKKTSYEKYGDFNLKYKISSDYEFMLRLRKQGAGFYFIEAVLANFYLGGISSRPLGTYESLEIRHNYGLISTTVKNVNRFFLKLKMMRSN
ncbi:glycosyltransferase involved in cell wall biosynthesis [Chitinophaga sp. W3I9]